MKNEHILIFSTASCKEEAEKIAEALLQDKLAACINIIDSITSVYAWQGKKEKSRECLLLIKSRKTLFDKIEKTIRQHHSYDVPEIISVEIGNGSKAYLDWIDSAL